MALGHLLGLTRERGLDALVEDLGVLAALRLARVLALRALPGVGSLLLLRLGPSLLGDAREHLLREALLRLLLLLGLGLLSLRLLDQLGEGVLALTDLLVLGLGPQLLLLEALGNL